MSGDKIKLKLDISDREIKATILEKQMTEQEVDIITDTTDKSEDYLPATISKTQTYDESKLELDYFDELLSTYGSSIRNLELIGYSNRYNAFQQYMKGAIYWCSILAESVEEFVKVVRQEIINNEKIEIEKFEEIFRDFCRIIIPCMAESNLFEALGTKKMATIFTNYYYSIDDYNLLDKFIALLVSLDIKSSKWKELFDDFLINSTSKDLRFILFVKMIYLYKICHFGKNNNTYLAEKLYVLNKSLNKKIGTLNGENKTNFINQINKTQQNKQKDDD